MTYRLPRRLSLKETVKKETDHCVVQHLRIQQEGTAEKSR